MSQKMAGQLTLRGIPENLYRELKEEASRLGKSINRVILDRILPERKKKGLGACAELRSMSGTWNQSRFDDFNRQIRDHRKIDPELWS